MISDIFTIRDVPRNSTGVLWSVSWPGRGTVIKPNNVKQMWDMAWQTGAYSISFAMDNGETYTINDTGSWSDVNMFEHVFKTIEHHGGLVGVGFVYEEEAINFVEAAEKLITWKMLSKNYD